MGEVFLCGLGPHPGLHVAKVGNSVQDAISSTAAFWSWAQQCAMTTFYGDGALPPCPVDHLQMRGERFASGLRLPIRDVKIFLLPQKSFIDGKSGSKVAVVVSILFLTLRTKALLRRRYVRGASSRERAWNIVLAPRWWRRLADETWLDWHCPRGH